MTTEEIIITPEYWKQPHEMSYNVKKPDGTCWNVSAVSKGIASIWTVNAWGTVYYEAIAVSELKPVNIRPMFEGVER